jgi:hypothetical protein
MGLGAPFPLDLHWVFPASLFRTKLFGHGKVSHEPSSAQHVMYSGLEQFEPGQSNCPALYLCMYFAGQT